MEPQIEKVGHGLAAEVLGHDTGSAAQDDPRHQGADQRVAKTDPSGSQTEVPAELSGISDKDNRRKVRCTKRKRRQPRAHRAASQHESVDVLSTLAAHKAHQEHSGKEHHQKDNFYDHSHSLLAAVRRKN